MKAKKARKILNQYLQKNELPIYDVVIEELIKETSKGKTYSCISFIELLKIAYKL